MAEHSSGDHSQDMEAHRSTYNAFIKGAIALSIHCGYVLVALVAFRFGQTLQCFYWLCRIDRRNGRDSP